MSDQPGEHLEEEPQDERGASGSRDASSEAPGGDRSGRPAGTSDEQSDSTVTPEDSRDADAPYLQSGGN